MRRCILFVALLAVPVWAADWVEYRSGPFHVYSDAGDRAGREALTRLEQLRFVLGNYLGKNEITPVWPIDLVLFANQREYGPHALPKPVIDGSAMTLAAWSADTPLPHDLLRAITRILLEDNAGRMPEETETAICDLMSTIDVKATIVRIGAPPAAGELPPDRMRQWAKLQMAATLPEFSGKLRVYLNNLQNAAEEDTAARNAFDMNAAKFNARADEYFRAGKFEPAQVNGKAVNPNRDYIEKNMEKAAVEGLMTELAAQGKNYPPESPRGLLAKNTHPSLELAIKANPRWAEPHFKLAALEDDRAAKIAQLKAAATLAPRNAVYWQTLAMEQAAVNLFADAEKSWSAAERAAVNPAERARIHQAKLALEAQRAEYEVAQRRREQEEEARELQRLKDQAAAEVHAAEQKANQELAAASGPLAQAPVKWSELDAARVNGTLANVECVGTAQRLSVKAATGETVALAVRDPKRFRPALECGTPARPRKVEVQYKDRDDTALGTEGDVVSLRFP
jgi:hypothetical protein